MPSPITSAAPPKTPDLGGKRTPNVRSAGIWRHGKLLRTPWVPYPDHPAWQSISDNTTPLPRLVLLPVSAILPAVPTQVGAWPG